MNLDWILLAEGFGTASNGAVTVIGINQQVVISPSLPITTKRGILAHYAAESSALLGQEIEVTLTVTDPAGGTLLTQTASVRMNPTMPWPDLPAGFDIFLEIPLRLTEYGAYEISLSAKQPDGEPVTGRVSFFVKESPPPSPKSLTMG